MLVIALLIRLTMGPGVIFRQTRVGLDGRDFTMYKFRTMLPTRRQEQIQFQGPDRRMTHKAAHDPRHTPVGRLLRKSSLDELPQFLNVLSGQMSFVGPRPEISSVVEKYHLRDHPRHAARPGITGAWQVTSRNEGVLLHECFDQDLSYVRSIRLSHDLRILGKTVTVLARRSGR
ncbi:MAG: glycosyl transferase [Ilumatobacteraceae bacterium]|nr:glycosyl transferase [Ilumatobacteraceae bacterium]